MTMKIKKINCVAVVALILLFLLVLAVDDVDHDRHYPSQSNQLYYCYTQCQLHLHTDWCVRHFGINISYINVIK